MRHYGVSTVFAIKMHALTLLLILLMLCLCVCLDVGWLNDTSVLVSVSHSLINCHLANQLVIVETLFSIVLVANLVSSC